MITLNQKLPLDENASFVARTYRSPVFETPWHQHVEIEIALIKEGYGSAFAGNFIGEFAEGEVYLFGSHLPHWFKNNDPDGVVCSALVVQFDRKIFGEYFLKLPEMEDIKRLFEESKKGMKLKGELIGEVTNLLLEMERQRGFTQLSTLLQCLHQISISQDYELLSQYYSPVYTEESQEKIALVFEHAMNHFKENITLEEMAALTNQSVSNFCRYFKHRTKKTFITFLNEIRIGHACKLLKNSNMNISQICFESGFASWANFSNHFKKLKGMSPKAYRNMFRAE